jgi:PEP-CTERM motif
VRCSLLYGLQGGLVTTGHSPEIIGLTPEPATAGLMLLGLGMMMRKLIVQRNRQVAGPIHS